MTLLEILRRVAVVVGAISLVIAPAWFRFALFDEEVSLSAIFVFGVAAIVFGRAYWAGTPAIQLHPRADLWDRGVAWLERHGAILALIALTALVGVMYTRIFLGETVGDDLTFHMAESVRLADCIRAGDWDLWNPSANGGYASAYYYQVIPQLASALPAALFDHHLFWFQLSLWLPQVLAPAAAYRGMRMMGATPWQSACAAFAVVFISGASRWGTGADGTFQVGLYTQTWALAAFPLGLGYGVRWLVHGDHLAAAIGWGVFVFLCHPFASIALCTGLAFGVLAHYLRFPVCRVHAKIILLFLLGAALAINVIALVQDPRGPPEADWAPKYIYLAPLLLFAGLIARVATSGKPLTVVLLVGVALAFVANAIGFATITAIPKRPEAATEDLPAVWTFATASLYVGPMVLLAAIGGRLALALQTRADAPDPDERPAPGVVVFVFALFVVAVTGGMLALTRLWLLAVPLAASLGVVGWLAWPIRREPVVRLVVLGACLLIATVPGWITLVVDRDGFGGFPHRVNDEVGPGYQELMRWYTRGELLDNNRLVLMTWALPLVVMFARMRFARWLWTPALVFAALLALGPHTPTTADDLLPAVRFLGAMQVALALGIGAGAYAIGAAVWNRRWRADVMYGVRTAVIAVACGLVVITVVNGGAALADRVNVLESYDYADELVEMNRIIAKQPQGRKQVGPGCENHWWNLLSYVYTRRPSLLQMGGGGLQASPNYDFVWSVRDFPKLAWVYDTPLFLFSRDNASTAPAGDLLGHTARYELRRLPAPGIVSPVQVTGVLPEGPSRANSPVRVAAIEWLKSQAPLDNQVLAYHGYGEPGPPPDAKVVRAFRVDPSPGDTADLYADVEVAKPTTFIARESWHPRWHAYVDGLEVPVRRVTPDFPAIDVAPGNHVLAFRFERPWWAQATWLLWPGIVITAWLATRRRRGIPTARVIARPPNPRAAGS